MDVQVVLPLLFFNTLHRKSTFICCLNILLTSERRILYAWQNPGVPVDEVMRDICRAFHHPALRDESLEIHRNMFNTVKKWVDEQPNRNQLGHVLSSQSVKDGKNHKGESNTGSANRGIESGHSRKFKFL